MVSGLHFSISSLYHGMGLEFPESGMKIQKRLLFESTNAEIPCTGLNVLTCDLGEKRQAGAKWIPVNPLCPL